MRQVESEIQIRVRHLNGEQKNAVLSFIKELTGSNAGTHRKRKALRQIRAAIDALH
jgi:hypothetical protein